MESEKTKIEMGISDLRNAIEEALGCKIAGPKTFEQLRQFLFNRTGQYLGMTTLKRIWQYINDDKPLKVRPATLSVLAKSIGYKDWDDFSNRNKRVRTSDSSIASSPKFGRSIDVVNELHPADELTLYWSPGRECRIKYLGNLQFEVVSSKNTRLKPGNTFYCHLFLAGHPLYLSSLVQGDAAPVSYICGKLHGGIQFEINAPSANLSEKKAADAIGD